MSEQENITAVSDNKTTDNPQDKTNGSANGGMPNLNMIKSGGRFLTTRVGENKIFCKELFSDDEKAIYELMSDFAENELLPIAHDKLEEKNEELVRTLLKKMGELGLLGVDVPEKYGGSAMSKTGMCILAEGIAKGGNSSFATVWSVHTSIGSLGIIWYGNDAQKEKWLPGICTGEKMTAFGLTEPEAGSDATNSKTRGVLSDDGKHYIVNGQKIFISNGAWADVFTIALKIDGKFSSIVIEKGTPGFEIGAEEKKMGMHGSSTVPLYFKDCKVPVENLLGDVGEGAGPAFCGLNIGRFKLGASAIGGQMLGIQEAAKYAKERKAFGQSIANFGSIKEKLGDCVVRVYTLDSMCYNTIGQQEDAISELDENDPEYYAKQGDTTERFIAENSIVKIYGSEGSREVVDHCLQIFGGYGFIEEYPMARAYRDERINRIWEGTNEINRMLCGRDIITKTLTGELGFREYLAHVNDYCSNDVDSGYVGDYKAEVECVEASKAIYALALNEALSKYGQDIGIEQVLMEKLADILIFSYVADSTLSRVLQNSYKVDELPGLCVQAYVAENGMKVVGYAQKIFNSIFDSNIPKDIQDKLDKLGQRLTMNTDTIKMKKIIGEKTVEVGGYPIKNF